MEQPPYDVEPKLSEYLFRQFNYIEQNTNVGSIYLQQDIEAIKKGIIAIEADLVIIKADIVTIKADIVTIKADIATIKADIVGLKSDMSVAQSDIAQLYNSILRLEPKYGGIRKTAAQSLGTLGATYIPITNYALNVYSLPAGVTSNLTNGTLTIAEAGNYNVTINTSVTFTSDNSTGRTFSLRLFDMTTNLPVPNQTGTIFVGSYAEGSVNSLTVPVQIAGTNHPIRVEIGGASANFANASVNGCAFFITKVSV